MTCSAITEEPVPPLLRLPAELRNRIIEHVLVEPSEIRVYSTVWQPPALLQTCRSFRHGCAAMYYQNNIFTVSGPSLYLLRAFVHALQGSSVVQFLRCLKYRPQTAVSLMDDCARGLVRKMAEEQALSLQAEFGRVKRGCIWILAEKSQWESQYVNEFGEEYGNRGMTEHIPNST